MMTETFFAPGISCAHCKATIEREMMELKGVRVVDVDVDSRRVTLTFDAPATSERVLAEMEEIGYPVAPRER